MENQAQRPEFIAALKGEVGTDARVSQPLGINFLYEAARLPEVRFAWPYPLSDLAATTSHLRNTLLAGSAFAFLVALILAAFLAQFTARRLQRIVEFAK